VVPPSDADHAQAGAFCVDLHKLIAQLDVRADKLRVEMGKYAAAGQAAQVRRVQRDLRSSAVERRELLDMLIAIGHSYPCEHDGV
jgi:adenylosuccinate lyase